jgi:uncharacterized protein (TIGR03000 family)
MTRADELRLTPILLIHTIYLNLSIFNKRYAFSAELNGERCGLFQSDFVEVFRMYSLVLLATMTASSATPGFFWGCGKGRCGGYGGWGGYSCYAYGGCYGSWSCYGGWGGYGGMGCYYQMGSGYGCIGGCYGRYGNGYGGYGGYGCFGGSTISPYGSVYSPAAPSGTMTAPKPEQVPAPKPEPGGKSKAAIDHQAKLIVELPADAKLYIDDQPMKTSSGRRVFRTPALDRGQAYYYILRAEVTRDGKPQTATKRVIVRAGQEVRAAFPELATPVETTAAANR